MHLQTVERLDDLPASEWERLFDADQHPCVSHAFLSTLETTGCVGQDTGWQPRHQIVRDSQGKLVAAAPVYEKTHSRGEFVFDWAWADALERAGHAYYPKWVCCVPFTPVPGPRIVGSAEGVNAIYAGLATRSGSGEISSVHVLFPSNTAHADPRWMERRDLRYVWSNQQYPDFDAFLGQLSSKRRKEIRRERRKLAAAGIHYRFRPGESADAAHWARVYALYARTYLIRGQHPYLTPEFFPCYAQRAPGRVVLIEAWVADELLAVAIALRGRDTLFGRHWGTAQDIDGLHFETCYYQGIEYCIEHGLGRYDAGVQGEQKRMRGFEPAVTRSMHHIGHPGLRDAVDAFLARERVAVDDWADAAQSHSAYRKG